MPGHQKLEHVELRVPAVDRAVDFCIDVMGLGVIDEDKDAVYLGCGLDLNYDIAFREGSPGMEHFAVRVGLDQLEATADRLSDADILHERYDGVEPGQTNAVRFETPAGLTAEVVTVEDRRFRNQDKFLLDRSGSAPLDIDHITLGITDLRTEIEFFTDVLGFDVTTVKSENGREDGEWQSVFIRRGVSYHDLAFFAREETKISHVAWELSSIEHMKLFIDRLAQYDHELETSIHRHDIANNLAAYFLEPGGGLMYEICAEEAKVDPESPPLFTAPEDARYSAWGGVTPASSQPED